MTGPVGAGGERTIGAGIEASAGLEAEVAPEGKGVGAAAAVATRMGSSTRGGELTTGGCCWVARLSLAAGLAEVSDGVSEAESGVAVRAVVLDAATLAEDWDAVEAGWFAGLLPAGTDLTWSSRD